MMNERINKALSGLKDFQAKTVEYVFEQLYHHGLNRMLIADEVGLGKTIVAKGIIAKGFEKYLADGGPSRENPTYNVIYICSNLALATQNIRKLNFMGEEKYVAKNINRLTYLALQPKENPPLFLINSLTPGTSFDDKSHQGEARERAILYCLLRNSKAFDNREEGLRQLLQGTKGKGNWERMLAEHWEDRKTLIRKDLFPKYRKALEETEVTAHGFPRLYRHLRGAPGKDLWQALLKVCKDLEQGTEIEVRFKSELIVNLRRILSRICLEYLNADIFILDEFQRYSNLIKLDNAADSPAIELARTVFELPNSKVLMLSATPFKPFTNDFDELNGEVHYKEFESVLRFLMQNREDSFWQEFQQDRRRFFSFLRHPDKLKVNYQQALEVKKRLEGIYREGIVRTERLLASEDRDALVKSMLKDKPLLLQRQDIEDFVALDQITLRLNQAHKAQLATPMEYVKSSPFCLSFLDNYQHRKKLEQHVREDKELRKLLKKTEHAWVNLKKIESYQPVIPTRSHKLPNAKLRLLLDETVENGGWKLLWIPPTLEYYKGEGAFKNMRGYSKSLIFSSWLLVPRMISALVSYEAERKSVGALAANAELDGATYFSKPRGPKPLFTFKVDKGQGDPQRMPNFTLLYPCITLASLYDPALAMGQDKTQRQLKAELVKELKVLLSQPAVMQLTKGEGDYRKWFWAAPLVLDRVSPKAELVAAWFGSGMPNSDLMIDAEDDSSQHDESSGKGLHFTHAKAVFQDPAMLGLPRLNPRQLDEVALFLANLALGSPAVCYLRAQLRHFELHEELLSAAFNVGSGFLTLFNKPESIAVVRLNTNAKEYLDKTLEYSIDGNMQAMLDEFLYLLHDCENLTDPKELANHLSDILSVRTSGIEVDDLPSFHKKLSSKRSRKERKVIRTHYAADFGSQKIRTANASGRQINIRQAFNSPFRPFVLASTSIGQEGLDFHLYCKKIFHWNLPSNPIDFEQREGRIHRYKGLVIRQNLAEKYAAPEEGLVPHDNIWELLFERGTVEKYTSKAGCELVPFWHTESRKDIKIERFVPLYPFSKDVDRYRQMLKVLTYYRLTFGQPRQEELIDALEGGQFDETFQEVLEKLLINLSPVRFLQADFVSDAL